jgi:hypothetical protein
MGGSPAANEIARGKPAVIAAFPQIGDARARYSSDECQVFCSDENDRLGAGDLEPPAATNVPACQHIVNPDKIVPRLLKSRPVLLVGAARQLRFLGSLQPAHVVLATLTAVRTTVNRFLYFFFLVEKIALVHKSFSLRPRRLSFTQLAQVPETINTRFVSIAPAKI